MLHQRFQLQQITLTITMHGVQVHSRSSDDEVAPVIHVQLANPPEAIWHGKAVLQNVVKDAFDRSGVLFTVHRLSDLDKAYTSTPASICIAVTANHSHSDMQQAAEALQNACDRCIHGQ